MFTRPFRNSDPSKATKIPDPAALQYRMSDFGYGKKSVRVFQVSKNGPIHTVTEFKVSVLSRLRTHKEYYDADNTDIIGSDVVESLIYIHAQKYGLTTPEEFALSLSAEMLKGYEILLECNVIVEDMSWQRLGEHENQGYYKNKPHNHVFMRQSNGTRYCEVVRKSEAPQKPLLIGGVSDWRLVKTACAPFVGYNKSGLLHSEGDMPDRILCVNIDAKWQYDHVKGIDFKTHWYKVRDIILNGFAGDPQTGVITTSVQYIAYNTERAILDALPEISSASIGVLNYPHLEYDYSRFPPLTPKADVVISNPKEVPISIGYAQLDRLQCVDNLKSKD